MHGFNRSLYFIPEALKAVISLFEENFPKVIRVVTSTAIGIAKEIIHPEFNKINLNAELSIVSDATNLKNVNKKINLLGFGHDTKSLIKIYDNHNIFVLPSFTEAHPQVVLEHFHEEDQLLFLKK